MVFSQLGEFLGTCLILLFVLKQLIKTATSDLSLAELYTACDLECLLPISRGIFVSAESCCNAHNYNKLLICPMSRSLMIVLLRVFTVM